MTFAARLRELADNAGLSTAQLAQRAGLPFGTVHRWMIGRSEPPFSDLLRLCQGLRVELRAFEACEAKR